MSKEQAWTGADDDRVRETCKGIDVGKLTVCPKCGMGDAGGNEMMLAHFCQHKYCPIREWRLTKEAPPTPSTPSPERGATFLRWCIDHSHTTETKKQEAHAELAALEAERDLLADLQERRIKQDAVWNQQVMALEARDADFAEAAGELLVEIPEPGTVLSKMLSANVLMRRESADLRAQLAHVLLGMELALIDLPDKPLDAAATLKVFAARVSADASKERKE